MYSSMNDGDFELICFLAKNSHCFRKFCIQTCIVFFASIKFIEIGLANQFSSGKCCPLMSKKLVVYLDFMEKVQHFGFVIWTISNNAMLNQHAPAKDSSHNL